MKDILTPNDVYFYGMAIRDQPYAREISLGLEFAEAVMKLHNARSKGNELRTIQRYDVLLELGNLANARVQAHYDARRQETGGRVLYTPRDLRRDLRAAFCSALPESAVTINVANKLPKLAARFYGEYIGGAFAEGGDGDD